MEFELSTQIYRVYQLHRKKIREVLKEYDINAKSSKQHYVDGYQRYISPRNLLIKLNGKDYMVTKELYEYQRQAFIDWRNGLK